MSEDGDKRNGVNALGVDDAVLTQFWNLASIEQEARQAAVKELTQQVVQDQQQYAQQHPAQNGAAAVGDDESAASLTGCSPLMAYTLQRLVRGLASNRQGARQGFALALTTIVQQADGVSVSACVSLMEKLHAVTNSMLGSEARDALLAQIFGCAALVRTGRVQDWAAADAMTTMLLSAGGKKAFLREVAAEVLLEMLDELEDAAVAAQLLTQNEVLRGQLLQNPAEAHPEALLLALRLWPAMPKDLQAACPLLPAVRIPANTWAAGRTTAYAAYAEAAAGFFQPSHLAKLLPVLRATTFAHPRLHLLWPTLLALLLPGFAPKRVAGGKGSTQPARPGQLEAFWQTVVEGDLFASSNERKYLGFQLFTILLPHLRSEQVPAVFSPAFMRCLNNHRSSAATALHTAAKRCLQRIAAVRSAAEDKDGHLAAAISAALSRHTGFGAAAVGQTREAPVEAAGGYIQELQSAFLEGGPDAEAAATRRAQLVEQLCGAVTLPSSGAAAKMAVLRFLALHALFDVKSGASKKDAEEVRQAAKAAQPVSAAVHDLCASRLLSLLGGAVKAAGSNAGSKTGGGKGGKDESAAAAAAADESAAASAAEDVLGQVSDFVAAAQRSKATGAARGPSEGQARVAAALQQAQPGAAEEGLDREAKKRLQASTHLLQLLCLYEAAAPGFVDADAANDLAVISAKAFRPDGAVAEPADDDDDEEAEPPWQDALLDVLLALLSRTAEALPSAALRDSVEALFRSVCHQLTPTGLQDLVRVLTEYEEGGGPKADLLEDADDMSEDGESGAEEAAGGSDDGASSGSDEEDDGAEAADFGRLVEAAATPEGEESEGEGMDDEAMAALEGGLAVAVKAATAGKPNSKERRQQMHNFKFRVVALLEVYVKRVPDSPHLPAMVPPLLQALEQAGKPSGAPALAERLQGLLTKVCHSKAVTSGRGLPAEDAATLLETALFAAAREAAPRVAAAAAAAFQYLLHVAQGSSAGPSPQVVQALRRALDDFFSSKKSRLSRKLLEGCLRAHPGAAASVLPDVLSRAADARTPYLKAEALALLAGMLRPPKTHAAATAEALHAQLPKLVAATVATMTSDFGKPQRHVEALRALAVSWESVLRLRGSIPDTFKLSAASLAELDAALAANETAKLPLKAQSQLDRLSGLIATARSPAAATPAEKAAKKDAPSVDKKAAKKEAPPAETQAAKKDGSGAKQASSAEKSAEIPAGSAEKPAGKTGKKRAAADESAKKPKKKKKKKADA